MCIGSFCRTAKDRCLLTPWTNGCVMKTCDARSNHCDRSICTTTFQSSSDIEQRSTDDQRRRAQVVRTRGENQLSRAHGARMRHRRAIVAECECFLRLAFDAHQRFGVLNSFVRSCCNSRNNISTSPATIGTADSTTNDERQ